MDEDKRKKKNKKKKNKSNKASEEHAVKAEGVSLDEIQGLQGTNTSSIINDEIISASELESEKNGQNAHGPADFSSGGQTTEPETRDSEKTECNVEPSTAETNEETQEYSEMKNALQRELAYSQALRSQLALLEEQMTNCTVSEVSLEHEIKKFKEEKICWLQKEVTLEKEIIRLKDEKSSWFQREAKAQEEIKSLADEKQSWLQKEVFREEEIERLKDENNSLVIKEIAKEDEVKGLRFENFHLQKEVEEMKSSLETLSLEHQKLTTQLETLSTAHSQHEQDIAIAVTPEVSKEWLGGGSAKDPVAEAARIAEDSRMQKEAAAAIVEKLVIENTELMEKVNQLSTIVDQLNKKCSSLEESKVRVEETAQDVTALSPLTFKENSSSTMLSNGVGVTNDPSVSIVNNDVTSYTESEIVEIMESNDPVTVEDGENGLSVSDSIGTVEEVKHITFNSVREPVDMAFQKTSETVPFSDAPVMGAPIRLVSFLTKYVTGADLVKPKNLIAS